MTGSSRHNLAVSVEDARSAYYTFTGKASDIVRQLALGGIGIVWLFKNPSGPIVSGELLVPAVLVVLALGLDLLHYVASGATWGWFQWKGIPDGSTDPKAIVQAPPWLNWPGLALYWGKILTIILVYILLGKFLLGKMAVEPPP